jgi:murein L,D-transpeptidase YafK
MKTWPKIIIIFIVLLFGVFLVANTGKRLEKVVFADRILVEKSKRKLSLCSKGVVLKSYKVSLGKNPIGDKIFEGDNKTPEGIYYIWEKCPSKFHKSLKINYPNSIDTAEANKIGKSAGGGIQIHGLGKEFGWLGKIHLLKDWTAGCIAVTNSEIDEIYSTVRTGTPVEIRE